MNQLVEQPTAALDTMPTGPALSPSAEQWKLVNRQAQALASSTLVPETYRGNVANCLIALEMANRMGASPLLVMQNLYVVHGNPSWSAKFLIGTFNANGRFSALRYEWNEGRTACRAYAVEKATGERLDGPLVSVDMARLEGWSTKSGSKWKTMPELMLMYRAAAFFIRTYAPELSMGLHTSDELEDIAPAPRTTSALATVREALADTPAPAESTDPETGEIGAPSTEPYAVLADRIVKATDAETAALVLDTARDLPDDQYAELTALFNRTWPAQ